jgi:HAD domain in Swiss Army Knife RNA repair proteins
MSTQSPIIFLDIDGGLLSTTTWGLPANVRLLREEATRMMSTWEFSERATFDPTSVMLVNRLCHRTGARIVLSTSWRKSFGVPETRAKLVAEGIEDALFHADYSCPLGSMLDKARDILAWLVGHGYDASPAARTWIAIDDDALEGVSQVTTDPMAGFGVREYRRACAWLGGADLDYGVQAAAVV